MKDVLKTFKVSTQALSTEAYPTASVVLPLQYVLLTQLKPSTMTRQDWERWKKLCKLIWRRDMAPTKMHSCYWTQPGTSTRIFTGWFIWNKSRGRQCEIRFRGNLQTSARRQTRKAKMRTPRLQRHSSARKRMLLVRWGDLFGDVYCQNSAGVIIMIL